MSTLASLECQRSSRSAVPRPRGVTQTRPPATPAAPHLSVPDAPASFSSLLSPTLCRSLKFRGGQVAVTRAPRGYKGAHPGPAPRPPSQPTAPAPEYPLLPGRGLPPLGPRRVQWVHYPPPRPQLCSSHPGVLSRPLTGGGFLHPSCQP